MTGTTRTAVIDIGSNSVRLVVYDGVARVPAVLFNEKVMAGLGRSLAATGAIDEDALATGQAALARFAWLAREMRVDTIRTVATAAVREASNGATLIADARRLGLKIEVLGGDEEATGAGMGVLSAFPDADGVVGDLGGGSLELVRVVAGTVTDRVSFPLGALRLAAIRAKGKGTLGKTVAKMLDEAGWTGRGAGLPFYMVGGSWRALTKLDMALRSYPLPVIHAYSLSRETVATMEATVAGLDRQRLKSLTSLPKERVPTLGDAAALLDHVMRVLGCTSAIASSYGLREGLLFARLTTKVQRQDPLIAAARDEGQRYGRFPEHGDLLDQWIAPVFADEPDDMVRLRRAACLLVDVSWRATPDFRAERAREVALHGAWVGIDAAGRALIAQALSTALDGAAISPDPLPRLASSAALDKAIRWGLAMRLGQRLSGGVAAPLERTRLALTKTGLHLVIADRDRALYGDAVERRHKALATALDRIAVLGG